MSYDYLYLLSEIRFGKMNTIVFYHKNYRFLMLLNYIGTYYGIKLGSVSFNSSTYRVVLHPSVCLIVNGGDI